MCQRAFTESGEYSKGRNTDDHTDNAPKTSEEQNGEEHPETRHAGCRSEYARSEYVAVKLLQDQDENQELQGRNRRHHEQNKCARDGTDKRSEERNHIGHTDKHTDEKRVRHLHKTHANVADDAYNHRVNNFTDNEAREHPLHIAQFGNNLVGYTPRQQRIENTLGLRGQRLLHVEPVSHYDETDEKVL